MKKIDFQKAMRDAVKQHGSQAALASFLGVSAPHVHDLIHGRRDPGPAILRKLGLRKVVWEWYERVSV